MGYWKKKKLVVYTDGASNPSTTKEAGWAFCFQPNQEQPIYITYYGYLAAPSTNNIAELLAIIHAIELTKKFDGVVSIRTDSQYSKLLFDDRKKYEREGLPPANQDLIRRLWKACDETSATIEIIKVKGHSGVVGNEVADRASVCAKTQDEKFFKRRGLEVKYDVSLPKHWYFEKPELFTKYLEDNNLR